MQEVIIDINGSATKIEVNGVKGKTCKDLTEDLEKALGMKTADKLKPEYHQQETRVNVRSRA